MTLALSIAVTGMAAQEHNINVISHNIANTSTTAYKEDIASFADIGYQIKMTNGAVLSDNGDTLPAGLRFGLGVAVRNVYKNFKQGALVPSDSQYSIAIDGPGFYHVILPSGGDGYSRDGHLQLNAQRELTDSNGFVLQPSMTIPDDALSITITTDGRVQVQQPNQTNLNEVGIIELSRFNVEQLSPIGNNLYMIPPNGEAVLQGPAGSDGLGMIKQFFLEESNGSAVEQLASLIIAQRAFETNSKVVQTADQMLRTAIDVKA